MKTIYKKPGSKKQVLKLYDKQLKQLNRPYKDLFVDTTYGSTHLIETGNLDGKPLLVFHGGNSTTAYNLLACNFLLNDFHVYAVDTIGHPGKSAEVSLSANNSDYGKWANDVIDSLGFQCKHWLKPKTKKLSRAICFVTTFVEQVLYYRAWFWPLPFTWFLPPCRSCFNS